MKRRWEIAKKSTNQPYHNVAWEDDVYFQVLINKRNSCVHGLGLAPTSFVLWGIRYFIVEDSRNDVV